MTFSAPATSSVSHSRRNFYRAGAALGAAALWPEIGGAQGVERFPSQAITIIVPFAAGGATDVVARTLGQALGDLWKVPVVVENRVGAGGNIGADFVARAPATGHTLLIGAVSTVVNPPLYKTPPYLPRALLPVGVGVASHLVTVARSDLPANDVAGLLAYARSRPGGINAASAGTGTLSHLGLELLEAEAKIKIVHVPYKGSTPGLTDVMGGQVDIMIDSTTSAASAIISGKVKALAVHTPKRLPVLSQVPTFEEQGLKSMTFSAWNIFMVPAATPSDRIAALQSALEKIIREPAIAKALADRGLDPLIQTPAESLEFIRREGERWERVIREKNISP